MGNSGRKTIFVGFHKTEKNSRDHFFFISEKTYPGSRIDRAMSVQLIKFLKNC